MWVGETPQLLHVLMKHMNRCMHLNEFHCDGELLLLVARQGEEEQSCAEKHTNHCKFAQKSSELGYEKGKTGGRESIYVTGWAQWMPFMKCLLNVTYDIKRLSSILFQQKITHFIHNTHRWAYNFLVPKLKLKGVQTTEYCSYTSNTKQTLC